MTSATNSFELFPVPNQDLHTIKNSSTIWAGVTPSSTAELRRILQDDYDRWHTFFNDRGFHNHGAHTTIALWALGAHESVLEAAYKDSSTMQRPAFISPSPIDASNWKEHLADENFYNAYLKFFTSEIKAKGSTAVLEEYVFAADANVGGTEGKGDPAMVNRLMEGLIHPLIHTGYGFEFGLPGMVAEGLAQTAVHPANSTITIPKSVFQSDTAIAGLAAKLSETVGLKEDPPQKSSVHALTILARILGDQRFQIEESISPVNIFKVVHDKHGHAIQEYADQWTLDGPIEKKIEELVWLTVLIYGIGGHQQEKPFNADFFQMHFVTSSIFLMSVVGQLKRSSQEILLRAYLSTILVWYVGRGRAPIDIQGFYEKTLTNPVFPGATPSPHSRAFPSPTSKYSITPNPWLPIIQTTFAHPNEHLVKLQRALAHYAGIYGLKNQGHLGGTELKDADKLDGTLFLRTAILTADRLGWVREGEAPGAFDMKGFYSSA